MCFAAAAVLCDITLDLFICSNRHEYSAVQIAKILMYFCLYLFEFVSQSLQTIKCLFHFPLRSAAPVAFINRQHETQMEQVIYKRDSCSKYFFLCYFVSCAGPYLTQMDDDRRLLVFVDHSNGGGNIIREREGEG